MTNIPYSRRTDKRRVIFAGVAFAMLCAGLTLAVSPARALAVTGSDVSASTDITNPDSQQADTSSTAPTDPKKTEEQPTSPAPEKEPASPAPGRGSGPVQPQPQPAPAAPQQNTVVPQQQLARTPQVAAPVSPRPSAAVPVTSTSNAVQQQDAVLAEPATQLAAALGTATAAASTPVGRTAALLEAGSGTQYTDNTLSPTTVERGNAAAGALATVGALIFGLSYVKRPSDGWLNSLMKGSVRLHG